MRRLLFLPLLLVFIFAQTCLSQATKGVITGTVVDDGGAVLRGAQLKLLPLGVNGATDDDGQFTFLAVPAGSYTVTVSFVGFKPTETKVEVTAGQTQNLTIKLGVASKNEEILVVADRAHGEAEAINETRAAFNIEQVLPAEVITSLPNANVADAIGRFPSVVLFRAEGEGEYIQVRGTEPRLTNVTVDGITLPAPEPTVRQVRLDVIPSDMVEAIEMNKTLSANMDGNGIGGSVNLRTKSAGEQPTVKVSTEGGYTPIEDGRYVGTVSTDLGQRFGVKKQFGILVDGSYDYNGRGIDNIQPSIDPYSTFAQPFYDNNTIREYRYYRYRDGFSGSADYKFSENTGIYAHGFYSDLKDWGDKWYYEPQSTALAATGELPSTSDSSPKPKFYTSSKRPNASVGTLILGGRHTGSDSWITWETSASRSYEVDSAGNPKADFAWVGPTLYCNYNPMAQQDWYRPRFGTCDGPNSPLENATDWTFKDITISKGLVSNLDLTAATSYARNYQTHGHFGVFEAGFKFSNGHQTQDSTETVYDGWSTSASAGVPMTALQSGFENHDYYNGSFLGGHYGPVSNFNEVQNYTLANFSSYVDGYSTASDTYPNIFHTIERITAFYGMNDIDLGKLHVQTGLRFEETQMDTFGYLVTLYGAGSTQCGGPTNTGCGVPTGVANNPSYLDVLPSVQFRYKVTPDSAIRAVFARGVARPDPYQLVPYVTEDDSSEPATVDIGNPSLRPEHANNYDLLYENYLHPLGMIQAGVFFKQLTSPQIPYIIPAGVTLSALPANVLPPSLLSVLESYQYQGQSDSVTEYINGGNAYIYGFEASYQQHLNYLPGMLGGLGILANYSLTSSQIKDVPLRTDHPRLIDQAVNTWNVSPTYDTKRLSVRMGIAFNGANLNSYNWISSTLAPGAGTDPSGLGPKGPSGDIVTLAHLQVDAQASYRFWHGMSAVVSGLNLTNEVFGYYEGSIQFVNQLEYYKPTYSFGLRYSFDHEK